MANLFKQVKLELDSRFEEAELSFRCTWPEEKLICELDSQKTYRIFENLLVNISKYAMHGTRVYTKVCREDNEAVIQLLDVSAAEITVKAEDLTERFVQGGCIPQYRRLRTWTCDCQKLYRITAGNLPFDDRRRYV